MLIKLLRVAGLTLAIVLFTQTARLSAADSFRLEEPADSGRTCRVQATITVQGQFETPAGDGKSRKWDAKSEATYTYRERRLGGIGRDALAWRSVRLIDTAQSKTTVGDQVTSNRLHSSLKRLIVQGRNEGVEIYSTQLLLRRSDLDLLSTPGDSLAVLSVLPSEPVAIGDRWKPESWSVQMLCDLDAVLEADVECSLVSYDPGRAVISLTGKITGATLGAESVVAIDGRLTFDPRQSLVTELHLEQTEKRSVGTISPGMNVQATVDWTRTPTDTPTELADAQLGDLPLEPPASLLQLSFAPGAQIRFQHDRDWHVYHQTDRVAVLRLINQGRLIAQCNVSSIPAAEAGSHTSVRQFTEDIQRALGEKLDQIVESRTLLKLDTDQRFVHRIAARGAAGERNLHWNYYLCAAADGRQAVLVFVFDETDRTAFEDRDDRLIRTLEFLSPAPRTSTGGNPRR